jgi:hypothetical protein
LFDGAAIAQVRIWQKIPCTQSATGRCDKRSGILPECMQPFVGKSGAGEGNRTLVCSLGSCRSTIELRPQNYARSVNSPHAFQHTIQMTVEGLTLEFQ